MRNFLQNEQYSLGEYNTVSQYVCHSNARATVASAAFKCWTTSWKIEIVKSSCMRQSTPKYCLCVQDSSLQLNAYNFPMFTRLLKCRRQFKGNAYCMFAYGRIVQPRAFIRLVRYGFANYISFYNRGVMLNLVETFFLYRQIHFKCISLWERE